VGRAALQARYGLAFITKRKQRAGEMPFVMLHGEPIEKPALSPSMLPSPVSFLLLLHGSGIGGKSWKTKKYNPKTCFPH